MNNQGISLGLQAGVLLEKYGFHFSHSLGQNFLLDESFVRRLAACAAIVPGERVLEIGPGAGVMTRCLLEEGARVTAVELDQSLRPVLDEMLAGQKDARVVYADALKLDPGELFGAEAYRVVANLPYYITSDMILHLLRAQNKPSSITALVQKEAAERISAPMGGKNWCALSATVRYFGSCEALMDVPPECFTPRPHVQSVFLRIRLYGQKPVQAKNEDRLLALIRAAFFMRRKTLANNLCASFGMSRERALSLLEACGLDPKVRGEAVPLEGLCALSDRMDSEEGE